jgi:hypothetical protein
MAMVCIHNNWRGLPKVLLPYDKVLRLHPKPPKINRIVVPLAHQYGDTIDSIIRRIIDTEPVNQTGGA